MQIAAFTIAIVSLTQFAPAQTKDALKLSAQIPLDNVEGRIDHMAITPQGNRLFIAALGNNTVEIIDLKTNQRLHTIKDIREPQGIAVLGDTGPFAIASGQDSMCRIYDAAF